ncbi:MAG: tRNA (N6-isopentenyl adenosine(37)-C2)-methylthiotransferase MiaB [Clostridiaceae bacterium]|nr:tRNA (N6-isopentenyl adenosine(37)-C2)-methylthiotransferase MiaB [Clostridiaceae bacterium]
MKNIDFYIDAIRSRAEEFHINEGRPLSYFIRTFGCQQNDNDSEISAGLLEHMSLEAAPNIEEADVVIFNTCSVRENADRRFYGNLGNLKTWRSEEKQRRIGVMGCMPGQDTHNSVLKESFPYIDFLLNAGDMGNLPRALYESSSQKKHSIVDLTDQAKEMTYPSLPVKRENKHRALISIMSGCNNFCTYCIVPYARGRESSRDPLVILAEARAAVDNGAKEIMLIGQNVNSYGNDMRSKGEKDFPSFARLIEEIARIPDLSVLRYMTSHPKDLSDELIEVIGKYETIEAHIHLPLQSGSNRLLKKMNRRYTAEHYLELVNKLRSARPGISISTDIIVGFPGETEEDFEDTLRLMETVKFDRAFTFIYSPRSGTPAADWSQNVSDLDIQERFERLLDLQNKHSVESNERCLGKNLYVLVSGLSKTDDETFSGRTKDDRLVNFSLPEESETDDQILTARGKPLSSTIADGSEVFVKITKAKAHSLEGVFVGLA